jgi:hypothetical protein
MLTGNGNQPTPTVDFTCFRKPRRYCDSTNLRFDWQDEANAGETPIIDESSGVPAAFARETVSDYGLLAVALWLAGWVAAPVICVGDRGDQRNLT